MLQSYRSTLKFILIGIIITAFSSLGSSDPPGYGEADPVLMDEQLIKEIAAKRNCSPAQVCLLSLKRRGWGVVVRCRSYSAMI
jgi:diketogulonate reductase-like aldo/keto reductase